MSVREAPGRRRHGRPERGLVVDGIVFALLALTGVTLPLVLFAVLPAALVATIARRAD